jgi:hypothetical protein
LHVGIPSSTWWACADALFPFQKTNPVVAEIFSLMSRDEARHAGYVLTLLSSYPHQYNLIELNQKPQMHCTIIRNALLLSCYSLNVTFWLSILLNLSRNWQLSSI